jgi:hypothetical protein
VTAYNTLAPVPVTPRTHAQVSGLFGRMLLVAPGVVQVREWRAAYPGGFTQPADLFAGLATVPGGSR